MEPNQGAQIIDGLQLAEQLVASLTVEVASLAANGHPVPSLAVILVGSDPSSLSYVRKKVETGARCGVRVELITLPEDSSQQQILASVQKINQDDSVHGLIVQLPLPAHIHAPTVTNAVAMSKDVDGLTDRSVGAVALNGHDPVFVSCTPLACLKMLRSLDVPLRGLKAVVIGASNIVGIPMSLLLLKEGCTVTVCHEHTKDCAEHARQADILVVAVGQPEMVTEDWVKHGAIVLDVRHAVHRGTQPVFQVGITVVSDLSGGTKLIGDVHRDVRRISVPISMSLGVSGEACGRVHVASSRRGWAHDGGNALAKYSQSCETGTKYLSD